MTSAYFFASEAGLVPRPHARGPWADDMLHGRLLGGLAARALERAVASSSGPSSPADERREWRAARLTVDLFRPAAMAPVQVSTTPIRTGRKVQVIDATMTCDGHTIGRVTGLFVVTGEEPPGEIWRPDREPWPDPETVQPPTDSPEADEAAPWLFRIVDGGMGTGERSRAWTNDTAELVEGEAMSPLIRAAVSGDIACPLVNSGDQGLFYINADYTMTLGRYPEGDWIGIEAVDQIDADGIAAATALLVDRRGPFAFSGGASIARSPLVR